MKPAIPVIYNGDSYMFHLADDDSVSSIEFFANNQNVVAEPRAWTELDEEVQRRFKKKLKRLKRRNVDLTYTLEVLWSGLCHLNRIVSKLEEAHCHNDPKAKDLLAMSFDSDCESGDPTLLNYFFWYSCSAHPFLALFPTAFATKKKDLTAFHNMREFRNKVAAHPCHLQSDPRREDSEAARSASLRQFVTWNFGRYSVGRERTTDSQGKESSPSDWGWELTKTHEKLDTFVREKLSQALKTGGCRNRTSPARLLATVVSATVELSRN